MRALFLALALVPLIGCNSGTVLSPSAIIVPDAVTVTVGSAQVFTVQNATVTGFDLSIDTQDWSECITVDGTFSQANSIRLIARSVCRGYVHVTARIGDRRSPIVAVMAVK